MYGYDFSPDFGPTRKPFLFLGNPVKHCQIGRKTRRVDDWDYLPLNLASKKGMNIARLEHTCVPHTTCPCTCGWARSALHEVAASTPPRASSPERAQELDHLFQHWHRLHLPSPEFPWMFWDALRGHFDMPESQSNFDSLHPFFSPVVRHAFFNKHQHFLMHDPGFLHHQVTRLSHWGRRQHALRSHGVPKD